MDKGFCGVSGTDGVIDSDLREREIWNRGRRPGVLLLRFASARLINRGW